MSSTLALEWACKICNIIFYVSSWSTIAQIEEDRDVGKNPILPFISLAVNNASWAVYGHLIDDSNILFVSLVGVEFGIYYSYVHLVNSPAVMQKKSRFTISVACLFFALLVFTITHHYPPELQARQIGIICCALTVVQFGSPLVTLKEVILSKTTQSLDFQRTVASTLTTGMWFLYGYTKADAFVMLPNGFGATLSLAQLALFCIYPSRSHHPLSDA
ncbi:hypothetical protein SARC_09474 [Sphaeroforma arctica JP610]|uniref:Sugar transporter SWEET1 n=1 Tax=Sphaeroforma arctica JP610 TaxID=667725 RepID=A0A0L0FMV7_9EUKA|nr:hypothetical protein SARC_09474 [Sphaeroforma arctica JP610]KNC78079.1 hypothetical protein SARC_09474 [Sphaeroforma arctica JP610]|eukprot:XP_014151981.1 hypothetical protein SARC_09474 [Sphaeroforma arctica JP610]